MQWKVRKEPRTEVPSNLRLGRLKGRANSRVYLGLGLGAKAVTNVQRERETPDHPHMQLWSKGGEAESG